MRLLISPSANSCSPIVVSVAPSGIVTVTRRVSVGRRLVGQRLRLVPPHEVLDDAVLDGARVLLDPGHHPRREDRVEPEDDEDAEERNRAQDPHEQEERLDPAPAAHRSLALLAQLADAGIAALLVLASAHSVSSGQSGPERCPAGGRRASRYCCRITRAAAESSSPLPRSACRPPVDRSSAACHELSRSSS